MIIYIEFEMLIGLSVDKKAEAGVAVSRYAKKRII